MASKMFAAKLNILNFPLFLCFMPHINGVWPVYIPWGPHNVIVYNWIYRCYGNYNRATINSVKGGKNSKTAINFTFLLIT